jgi:PAS domain S-box-containing protein
VRAEPTTGALGPRPLRRYRAWVGRSITNRATAVASALALAVTLVLGVTSYVTVHRLLTQRAQGVLEAHARQVEQELHAGLHAALLDVQALAANSLVANGLVDSTGRDTYLVPLLREHAVPGAPGAELVLCDFRGRPIASNRAWLPDAVPELQRAAAAAADTAPHAAVEGAGGGAPRVVLTFPVVFPPTGQMEGVLVARLPLEPMFTAAVRTMPEIEASLAIDGVTLGRPGARGRIAIRHERPVRLHGAMNELGMRLTLGQDASALAPVRIAGLIYLLVGALALVAVSVAARGTARDLTRRIAALSDAAREIAAGTRAALPAPRDPGDEVDTVTRAFTGTLEKLRAIQDSLEQKVQERTADLVAREHELQRSREQLAHAVEGSFLGVWSWDLGTGVVTFNDLWPKLLGYEPAEIGDTFAAWASLVHPDDRERVGAEVVAHLKGSTSRIDTRYRMRARDGSWRWIHSRGQAMERDATGRVLRIAGTHADITAIEDLHRRLFAATRLASVGTLAAGVAHEINNPLMVLTANLELCEEELDAGAPLEKLREELRVNLSDARSGAARIAAIVRSMRTLGGPGRGDESREVDVRTELLDAIQMVRNQLVQRARLEVSVPSDLPRIRARTAELGRVFVNLLLNALQAIPEGAAERNRILVAAWSSGDEIAVEIVDTGAGIPPALRERVFDAFFTTKPVGVGTGLGLTIAASIVEGVGGRIELESEVGHGSTFRVRLPAAAAPGTSPPGPDAGEEPALAPPAAASAGASTERRRVLVIDDEPPVRRALERQLRDRHEVVALASAEEAVRRLDAGERFDAILCDLMMTGMDGMTFHEAVTSRHPDLRTRIAFVTGGAFGERATRFVADHDVVIVSKPVDRADLLRAVERLAGCAGEAPAAADRGGAAALV